VLDYERIARGIIKQQSNVAANNSNVTDTVTPAHSVSTSSQDVSQSTNLMKTQTQFNNPAAFPEVQTTDTYLNTNIHQLVDNILIQDNNVNESPATCSSGSALSNLSNGIPLRAHVGQKIKEKIWADELIELKVLLPGNVSPVDPSAIKLTPNSFTVQQIQTDVDSLTQEQVRSLLSFQEWTECFHIFIAIYIQKYPEEAPHLLKYMSTIKEIHEMKGVVAFHYMIYGSGTCAKVIVILGIVQ